MVVYKRFPWTFFRICVMYLDRPLEEGPMRGAYGEHEHLVVYKSSPWTWFRARVMHVN